MSTLKKGTKEMVTFTNEQFTKLYNLSKKIGGQIGCSIKDKLKKGHMGRA